jgi:hypothetical protein
MVEGEGRARKVSGKPALRWMKPTEKETQVLGKSKTNTQTETHVHQSR